MSRTSYRRLAVERLEDRRLLATTAQVVGGKLSVTSTTAADLVLTQTAANTWTVSDFGLAVGLGTFTGVTGDISVKTSAAADTLAFDLQGFTAPKGIAIDLGNGVNQFSIEGGVITNNLSVRGGLDNDVFTLSDLTINGNVGISTGSGHNDVSVTDSHVLGYLSMLSLDGDDTLTLGDGIDALAIDGDVVWTDRGGSGDALDIQSGVTLGRHLKTSAINDAWLRNGSSVAGSLLIYGGAGVPNALTLAGAIDGSVTYRGSSDVDTIDVQATADIGRSMVVYLGGGDDVADLSGTIGNALVVYGQSGNDEVTIDGQVFGSAGIWLGDGDDLLVVSDSIGVPGSTSFRLVIDGGRGNDRVSLRDTAEVNGALQVNLGAGDDQIAVASLATIPATSISGGSGSDTYYDALLPRVGVLLRLVETQSTGPLPPWAV